MPICEKRQASRLSNIHGVFGLKLSPAPTIALVQASVAERRSRSRLTTSGRQPMSIRPFLNGACLLQTLQKNPDAALPLRIVRGQIMSTPIRRMRSGCCAQRCARHDTAPPRSRDELAPLRVEHGGTSSPVGWASALQPAGDDARFTSASSRRRTGGRSLGRT
jgi:hypothetical protein